MPFYRDIDSSTPAGKRTLDRQLELRAQLAAEIPARTQKETLLLATHNQMQRDESPPPGCGCPSPVVLTR